MKSYLHLLPTALAVLLGLFLSHETAVAQTDSLSIAAAIVAPTDTLAPAGKKSRIANNYILQTLIDYSSLGLKMTQQQIERLEERDTAYVSPNLYNMTVMTEYSYWYEYYRISTTVNDREQSLSFAPGMVHKLGLYVGWRWLFLGWSFDLQDPSGTSSKGKTDWNFSFYTAKLGFDLFYRKTGHDFRIIKSSGFYDDRGHEITHYPKSFGGMQVHQKGVNLYYIFNNRNFSYPAAYSQSTNQRKSSGSLLLGLSYSKQEISFDEKRLPAQLQQHIDSTLMFNQIAYYDYSINAGYSYNWVFAKNWLANASVTPAIGYKRSMLESDEKPELKTIFNNINIDLVTRFAIVYNNAHFYAGASLVSHYYSYRRRQLTVDSGFGVLRVYAGLNFWRKKEAR